MAEFSIESFEDDATWATSVTNKQMGGLSKPLVSSTAKENNPQLSVTTMSVSDIMQGSALHRPDISTLSKFENSLQSDLRDLVTGNGGAEKVLGGRSALLPFDIMLDKGYSDGRIAMDGAGTGFDSTTSGGKFNSVGTGSAGQFLALAAKEIEYTESPRGSNNTKFAAIAGHANGQAWCATFVTAIANQAGVVLPVPSASTVAMAEGFKKANKWVTSNPLPGDIVFFDFPNDSKYRIQHVGIVESVSGSDIITIEGNTSAPHSSGSQDNGGGVYRRTRGANSGIQGYGRPDFPEAAATTTPTETNRVAS